MQKEFVRELDHTYLIPGDIQIDENEYVFQMALRGKLPGILPLGITAKDGKKSLRADVTACTSIASRFQSMALGGSDLRKILSAIRDTTRKMPGLLMTAQDLLLEPECIFFGPEGDEVLLCYIPHLSDSEPYTVRTLSEFILKHVNHSDQAAARLAYSLYDQVSAESFLLPDLLTELLLHNSPAAQARGDVSTGLPDARQPYCTTQPGDSPQPGYNPQSGYSPQPGYNPQPGYSPQPGYNPQSGYSPQPGYNPQPGCSPQPGSPDASPHAPGFHSSTPDTCTFRSSGSGASAFQGSISGTPGFRDSSSGSSAFQGSMPGTPGFRDSSSGASGFRGSGSDTSCFRGPAPGVSGSGDFSNFQADSDFAELSHSNFKRHRVPAQKPSMLRRLLPSFLILPSACVIMILFQMDLTQILGMGFLCVSVIWIIHTSLEKRANEKRNIWFDEDPEAQSDDQFYQALRKELYAEDGGFNTSCQPMQPSAGHGMQEEKTRLLHAPGPVLISLDKDRSQDLPLNRDHLILGKSRSQCDIVLSGDTISRKHARIERRMDGYYVTDLFSTNGTFLDGHRLESGQAVAIKDGAQLTIASTHFRVSIPEQAA